MKKLKQFRQGAASFYVVIFATLILMVVVASFAAVIASEIARTSNDDLSQSAYDSAMAGVEDAKLAYYNYRNCLAQGATKTEPVEADMSCGAVIWYMEATETEYSDKGLNRCDMVKYILGRNTNEIVESNTSNNMQQEYTCVEINDSLGDYRSTVSSSNTSKVVKVKFDDGVVADEISSVKISWYMDNGSEKKYSNFNNGEVTFPSASDSNVSVPPTISLGLIQTAESFNFADFDYAQEGRTNRGMIYLVPTYNGEDVKKNGEGNYILAYNDGTKKNYIGQSGFVKSNDKTVQNLPYVVYCGGDEGDEEFLCSATVELPKPIGGYRNNNTFVFVVGLPYGKPATDFSLEFYCGDKNCKNEKNDETTEVKTNKANLKGVQVDIDSTGRANDLYRRVEVRLESSSDYSLSVFGPIELFGDTDGGDDTSLKKLIEKVTTEYNF